MKKWVCPKCDMVTKALAKSVGHRCPMNKNKWVEAKEAVNEVQDGAS